MVATTADVNDSELNFHAVCSYLCLKIWGSDHEVKSVTLTSNGGEAIAGKATLTPVVNGTPLCVMTGSESSIKLNCDDGVVVGTTEAQATEFWMVVPPVTLANGYTLTIKDFYGATQTVTIDSSHTFTSNTIYDLLVELTTTTDGPGMGIGGWKDGDQYGGSTD